jgi:hypothetical protein
VCLPYDETKLRWPYGRAKAPSPSALRIAYQESGSTQLGVLTRGDFTLNLANALWLSFTHHPSIIEGHSFIHYCCLAPKAQTTYREAYIGDCTPQHPNHSVPSPTGFVIAYNRDSPQLPQQFFCCPRASARLAAQRLSASTLLCIA